MGFETIYVQKGGNLVVFEHSSLWDLKLFALPKLISLPVFEHSSLWDLKHLMIGVLDIPCYI